VTKRALVLLALTACTETAAVPPAASSSARPSSKPSASVSASAPAPGAGAEKKSTRVEGLGYTGVIFTDGARGFGLLELAGEKIIGTFTPTPDDVAKLEAGVFDYLKAHPSPQSPKLHEKLASYKRQYLGLTVGRHHRPIVYANFFCRGDHWEERVVAVKDGGDCYFQIAFELRTSTFSDLMVNGEA
jgi:hypothetical protein